jgi:hypothetical protein
MDEPLSISGWGGAGINGRRAGYYGALDAISGRT